MNPRESKKNRFPHFDSGACGGSARKVHRVHRVQYLRGLCPVWSAGIQQSQTYPNSRVRSVFGTIPREIVELFAFDDIHDRRIGVALPFSPFQVQPHRGNPMAEFQNREGTYQYSLRGIVNRDEHLSGGHEKHIPQKRGPVPPFLRDRADRYR